MAMTKQETVVSVKASAIIGIATVIFAVAASYTTNRLQTEHAIDGVHTEVTALQEQTNDHETRIRSMESCIQDIAAIRADIRWIVYTMDRMEGATP